MNVKKTNIDFSSLRKRRNTRRKVSKLSKNLNNSKLFI